MWVDNLQIRVGLDQRSGIVFIARVEVCCCFCPNEQAQIFSLRLSLPPISTDISRQIRENKQNKKNLFVKLSPKHTHKKLLNFIISDAKLLLTRLNILRLVSGALAVV